MYRPFFALLVFLGACTLASAQTVGDALRYSNTTLTGSARFAGTGGAMTPLGADFSVTSTNPAGLAWMRNSEFIITPMVDITQIDATLTGSEKNASVAESLSQFTLSNIGVTIVGQTRSPNWSTINFGIGLNRLADFNEEFDYSGRSMGSIVQSFVDFANVGSFDDFGNNLAIDAGAILEDDQGFFSDFDTNPEALVTRDQTVVRNGSINELVFSLAGNYKERLLWGATLGVPFLDYDESRIYAETDPADQVEFFDDLRYEESFSTTGAGVNFKFGLIARPSQPLRISLAVHSPTFYRLDDIYTSNFTYNYTFDGAPETSTAVSPEGNFTYSLNTPWRFMGGAGFLLGRSGFISADLDYVNYGGARFRYDDFQDAEEAINGDVSSTLSSALGVRVGGELAMESFRLRGGLRLQQSPIDGDDTLYQTYSAGLGYTSGRFFIDAAYQLDGQERAFSPFATLDREPQIINTDYQIHRLLLTLGFKF